MRGLKWKAIMASQWGGDDLLKHHKAAELLVENRVCAELISEIGVISESCRRDVAGIVSAYPRFAQIPISVRRDWYF